MQHRPWTSPQVVRISSSLSTRVDRDLSVLCPFGVRNPSQRVARSGQSKHLLNLGFSLTWYVSPQGQASLQGNFLRRRHAYLLKCLLKNLVNIVEIQALRLKSVYKKRNKNRSRKQNKKRYDTQVPGKYEYENIHSRTKCGWGVLGHFYVTSG